MPAARVHAVKPVHEALPEESRQAALVAVIDHRLGDERQSVAGLDHPVGEVDVLGAQELLVEAPQLVQDLASRCPAHRDRVGGT